MRWCRRNNRWISMLHVKDSRIMEVVLMEWFWMQIKDQDDDDDDVDWREMGLLITLIEHYHDSFPRIKTRRTLTETLYCLPLKIRKKRSMSGRMSVLTFFFSRASSCLLVTTWRQSFWQRIRSRNIHRACRRAAVVRGLCTPRKPFGLTNESVHRFTFEEDKTLCLSHSSDVSQDLLQMYSMLITITFEHGQKLQ